MEETADHFDVIVRAWQGDRKSRDRLVRLVEPRLYSYLYRLTLNDELARDLMQETFVKMLESLDELEKPERFWHWLFRTALGKVQHYYRDRARERTIHISALSQERMADFMDRQREDGLSRAIKEELSNTVCIAMGDLKLSYRNVLVLRCFEQLPFSEIAELMECKELGARVLFCRARKSLQKRLRRQGFGREMLLMALGVFGMLTAPAKAASSSTVLTASLLDVGPLACFVAAIASRLGLALAAGLGVIIIGITVEQLIIAGLLGFFVFVCFILALCTGS